jgi:HflK protein
LRLGLSDSTCRQGICASAYVDTLNSGFTRLRRRSNRRGVGARNQINIGFRSGTDGRSTQTADLTPESMMLTGDANIMHVQFTISWQITNAQDFFFQVDEVEPTIRAVADSAMREAVGQSQVDLILTKDRAKIQEQVRSTMQAVLDSYRAGVTILAVALQDTKPPAPVVEAFNDQQASDTDRQRSINEAETYAGSIVPKARGDASKILQDAEAFKTQAVTLAQGEAQRFRSIYQQYRAAPEVTRERLYVETMQRILSRSNKILIDATTSGVTPYLLLPELRRTQQPVSPALPPEGRHEKLVAGAARRSDLRFVQHAFRGRSARAGDGGSTRQSGAGHQGARTRGEGAVFSIGHLLQQAYSGPRCGTQRRHHGRRQKYRGRCLHTLSHLRSAEILSVGEGRGERAAAPSADLELELAAGFGRAEL